MEANSSDNNSNTEDEEDYDEIFSPTVLNEVSNNGDTAAVT